MKQLLAIIAVVFLVSGCFGPVKPEQTSNYVLNRIPTDIPQKKSSGRIVMVTPPETRPVFNTTQMAYTVKPFQVSYFAQNQWAETPSQMLQPLIVQTLQNTHHYYAIVSPPYTGKYDYILTSQILELQQNHIYKPSMAVLRVRVMLTRVSTSRVIAVKEFTTKSALNAKSPYSGVLAANIATAKFLDELADFCIHNT